MAQPQKQPLPPTGRRMDKGGFQPRALPEHAHHVAPGERVKAASTLRYGRPDPSDRKGLHPHVVPKGRRGTIVKANDDGTYQIQWDGKPQDLEPLPRADFALMDFEPSGEPPVKMDPDAPALELSEDGEPTDPPEEND